MAAALYSLDPAGHCTSPLPLTPNPEARSVWEDLVTEFKADDASFLEDLGEVRKMGTLASILRIQPIMNRQTGKPGGAQLLLKGHRRISIKDIAEQVQTLLPSPRR